MSAADLVIWGLVIHLLVDWLGQNETIATRKMNLRDWPGYLHAGMHGAAQLLIFPWWAALAIGVTHLLIDTRKPVVWWSRLIRQTQPGPPALWKPRGMGYEAELGPNVQRPAAMLMDLGADVRIWADQVWHIGVIAALALAVGS